MKDAVIKSASYILVHVPGFVRYGSKPYREIMLSDSILPQIEQSLWRYEDAVAYPPNQVFIGNFNPDELHSFASPWYKNASPSTSRMGEFGEIMPEEEFHALMKISDDFDLFWLERDYAEKCFQKLSEHALFSDISFNPSKTLDVEKIENKIEQKLSIGVYNNGKLVGCMDAAHDIDESLQAPILLENLATKASGVLAMKWLLSKSNLKPQDVDFVISCGEEAVGDRYQRGGGNIAKAIGEAAKCVNASGCDVKAFCAAPIYAIINAACMIKAGLFKNIVVVGGGSMAKLGMKFQAHLKNNMPILEDVLGGMAFLISEDDGMSPLIRLDSVGKHHIGAGSSNQDIMEALVFKPLSHLNLKSTDIDKYAVEMHNPEITLPSGSGDVPRTNYRMIAAIAASKGEIRKDEIDNFLLIHGMPGFSPTQGHIPAGVPYIGHALKLMRDTKMQRSMFIAKGSLFLGRMTHMFDGLSFILERNNHQIKDR